MSDNRSWLASFGSREIALANSKPRSSELGQAVIPVRARVAQATRSKMTGYKMQVLRMAGRCRHARAVYELAHNLMWLDVA